MPTCEPLGTSNEVNRLGSQVRGTARRRLLGREGTPGISLIGKRRNIMSGEEALDDYGEEWST